MTFRIRLTQSAEDDIAKILAWSEDEFGVDAADRYEQLIDTAIADLAADPSRIGSVKPPELGPNASSWHLAMSKNHVPIPKNRVKKPRHVIHYYVETDIVTIRRVLHDSMEPNLYIVPTNENEQE